MTTTFRRVILAVALLGLAGTGCGSCLDREKKKEEESDRPQARTTEEYGKKLGHRSLASQALSRDAGPLHAQGGDGGL